MPNRGQSTDQAESVASEVSAAENQETPKQEAAPAVNGNERPDDAGKNSQASGQQSETTLRTPNRQQFQRPPFLQAPKNKLNGWMWAFIGVAVILGVSVILNIVLAVVAVGGGTQAPSLSSQSTAYVMGDRGSSNKILEIRISGTIMNEGSDNVKKNMILRVRKELEYAKKEKNVKAILLTIDSPGGGITATDLIYNDIMKLKAERKIPVVAYCEDITASGGYYIASSSDCIYATKTSLVGSIGVISQFMDMEQLFKKVGIRWNVITSNKANGKKSYKDIGSFAREMTPEEKAFMQSIIQEMWDDFVGVVAEGRKGKLTKEQVANLADGRIYTGKMALNLKLIDKIGYKEDAVKEAESLANIYSSEVITCTYPGGSLKDLFESSAEKSIMPSAKDLLDEGSPKLMFLWNGKN